MFLSIGRTFLIRAGQIEKDLRDVQLKEFSIHTFLMLFAFLMTLVVAPSANHDYPFSSAQEFLNFKASSQKQFMDCDLETIESENWVRRMPVCHFGGYRPNGPESAL